MIEQDFHFPDDFIWGTTTAAYQIEGAADEDGKGPSIWDTFARKRGFVRNSDNGDVACDHYHRWQGDIDLMRELNTGAYRFSISWPRIYPEGRGRVNQPGLDFYSRLVDGLLDAGITPFVTLYHWDLPEALQTEGGWPERKIVDDYLAYADTVTRALGDRVKHWVTFNEPWTFTWLGYVLGMHAPGLPSGNPMLAMAATHHAYLAHGAAIPMIHANAPGSQAGISLNLVQVESASDSAEDRAAAARFDGFNNRWYLDPLFRGEYPADMVEKYGMFMPEVRPGDMEQIATPMDFFGVNYYTRGVIADEPEQLLLQARQVEQEGVEHTDSGWEVYPHGLYALLRRVHDEYTSLPLYVTESGAAFADTVSADGEIHDDRRTAYLDGHFRAAQQALDEGVPVKGYFVWSLMDNFEWAEGYSKRFGVYYVDYPTQRRTLKDSGRFLARVATGVNLPTK